MAATNLPYSQYALKDKASGSLSAELLSGGTSLTLTTGQGARFPSADFCVRIDDEVIYVGSRATDTLSSLTRGYNGTTAVTHPAGSLVLQSADAALFQRLYDNLAQHTHDKSGIPDFAHTHPQGDITTLVSDLAAKETTANKGAASGYASLDSGTKVPIAQVPTGATSTTVCVGNDSRLSDARTPLVHATSHQSGGADAIKLDEVAAPTDVTTLNATTTAHGLCPKFPGGTTTFLRADGAFAAPGGGSDPWTYAQVNGGADFTTTSATAVDATGLSFTPVANTTYEFEAWLLIRTATTTVNPRVGLAWATGGTDGVAMIEEAQAAATVPIVANGNLNAALLIAVGGLPNTTQSWPVRVQGMFRAGATPSGNVRIQLASETAGTTVRIVARSFLKYRTLAF